MKEDISSTIPRSKEGERRQATVLFADISGFTSLSEKMDPEEVTAIVNDCLERMGSIVEKHSGTVDKYMGDCVMALFGVPVAIEEAPQKAINAAIEIRNMIGNFNQSRNHDNPLSIHLGLNTGMVITGGIGDEEKHYTAMGDAVNVASRLKDVSQSGQIFVGPNTYTQTKDNFRYQELKAVQLKGKEEDVPVFELLSRQEHVHRPRLGIERMIASEMVGRENELNILSSHLTKVLNGEGSIVSVIGEAGIGKSRLIAELRQKKEMNSATLLEGRALSIGKNLSFHPLIDLLKNWAGIKEEDSEQILVEKLEKRIHDIHPDQIEEIFPFIATFMGLKLTGKYAERIKGIEGEALEKLILKNLNHLIEKATTINPVVLVLEDLHWTDLTSLDFLGSLYRLALNNPILFINVMRPGYEETTERLLNSIQKRYPEASSKIKLVSLAEKDSDFLINNLLRIEGFPGSVKSLIVKRAAGNPFFIEEVLRSFIDEGVVQIRNERFEVTDKIQSVHIPETINEVLMARIDRLEDHTKTLLKVASVIGRSFFYRILANVAEQIHEIDDKLTYLEEVQLIQEEGRKQELEYLFKHALAQEATYESILKKKRKELHEKTAEAIEFIFTDKLPEYYGMLSLHYSQGENLDKAEEYLLKAGEEALRRSASREAIYYFEEGLRLYQDRYKESADPKIIMLMQKNLAFALNNKGRQLEAGKYFDMVLSYYNSSIPEGKLSRFIVTIRGVLNILIAIYLPSLKWRRTPAVEDQAIMDVYFPHLNNIAVTDPDRMMPAFGVVYNRLTSLNITKMQNGPLMLCGASAALTWGGFPYAISRKILSFLKNKIDKNNIRENIYFSFSTRVLDMLQGTWSDHQFDKKLVEEALKIGEVNSANFRICNDLYIDLEIGKFSDAADKAKWIGEIGQDFDNETLMADKYQYNALILLKTRRLTEALSEIDQAISRYEGIEDILQTFACYASKAHIQAMMGELQESQISSEHAASICPSDTPPLIKSCYELGCFQRLLGSLEVNLKDGITRNSMKQIQNSVRKSLKLSKLVAGHRTEILRNIGVYFWLINKQKKAMKWWSRSIKAAKILGARVELSRTYFEVGKRLLEEKSKNQLLDGITAMEYLGKARNMFEAMGLEWDLKQMEKLGLELGNPGLGWSE